MHLDTFLFVSIFHQLISVFRTIFLAEKFPYLPTQCVFHDIANIQTTVSLILCSGSEKGEISGLQIPDCYLGKFSISWYLNSGGFQIQHK